MISNPCRERLIFPLTTECWQRHEQIVNRYLPKTPRGRRDIFRYDEWQNILLAFDPWYRPMIEFMMLTGMIHSEISGLRRSDVFPNHIEVWQKIVRKQEGKTLKNMYRTRKIPITDRLREILDNVLARTDSDYVFAKPDGSPYLREGFIERFWAPALEKAGVSYRPPYSMRHSFAAWSLLIGVEPLRLVGLMGHSSKKMVFDVYGNYLDGLEQDYYGILDYFGKDYAEAKRKPLASHQNLLGESLVKVRGSASITP